MTREEIQEAVARGWGHPKCEKKEMDVVLANDIAEEVYQAQIDSWNKKKK